MSYAEICNAFLDGMNDVFSLMFTDSIGLCLLDEDATVVNVYQETPDKVYHSPIALVGKVITEFKQGENPVEGVEIDAEFRFPTKQLILNNIPRSSEQDLETLRKGKISYGEYEYLIEKVVPKTLVADEWQFYSFYCRVDKKTSLRG